MEIKQAADHRDVDIWFVSVVSAETDEQLQSCSPVIASPDRVAEDQVSVGEAIMSTGLIGWLVEFEGQL